MKPIVLLIIGLLLATLVARFYHVLSLEHIYTDGEVMRGIFRLTQEPQSDNGRTQRFSITPAHSKPVFVTTTLFPRYGYGDVLAIDGKLQVKVLDDNRQIVVMQFPRIRQQSDASMFPRLIGFVRARINHTFQASLSPLQASLLEGIVFGIKNDMPKSFLDSLKLEGLTHIVAASGMNISLVAGALVSIFSWFLPRRMGVGFAMGGIVLYGFLAGFEPSILRAMLMAIIALSAGLVGRQNFSLFSLVVTAYVMLFMRPENLTDIGFQLSFMATLGIFVIKPMGDRVLFRNYPKLKDHILFADITTTLAAQLTTLPILLTNFGQYNLLSVLTNLCVLWTIPPLMIVGGLGALLSFVSQFLAQLLLFASIPLLLYFIWMVELWQGFSVPLRVESFPVSFSIGYYFFLLAIIVYWYEKTKRYEKIH